MKSSIWRHVRLENLDQTAQEVNVFLERAPAIWCFQGQMGAGKTTFVKSLCRERGVMDLVQSPTFGLVNEYQSQSGETIYHFDFYRLESPEEAMGIGVMEYFDSGDLCLLEWPERIAAIIPEEHVQLQISLQPDNSRTIEVSIHGTTH